MLCRYSISDLISGSHEVVGLLAAREGIEGAHGGDSSSRATNSEASLERAAGVVLGLGLGESDPVIIPVVVLPLPLAPHVFLSGIALLTPPESTGLVPVVPHIVAVGSRSVVVGVPVEAFTRWSLSRGEKIVHVDLCGFALITPPDGAGTVPVPPDIVTVGA